MTQIKVEKLNSQLEGIGYVDGKITFIPKSIPGELVDVTITKEKKKFQEGTLKKVIMPSEKRTLAKCPYFDKCGGCDLEHLSYAESLLWKKNMLQELFQRNHLWEGEIPVVSSVKPWNYRNKLSLKVERGTLGFYEEKTHQFVEIKTCLIARGAINCLLHDFSLFAFQEGSLEVRTNHNDELLLSIQTEERVHIDKKLFEQHKIVGIIVNQKLCYGEPFLYLRNGGLLYKLSMSSFFQVNYEMSEKLFLYVRNILKSARNVLDLYSGIGTLGFQAAKLGASVTGIEVVQSAVLNAIESAKRNQFKSVSYHLGKVEDLLSHIPFGFDTVIVDPPRSGLDKKTRNVLLASLPQKILYVSCNPITLIRDLKEFQKYYTLDSVRAFDMFPYTRHVESVSLLSLKENQKLK